MKIPLVVVAVALSLWPTLLSAEEDPALQQQAELKTQVRGYLESKHSPLAPDTDFILQQKHWKLLIAISAIESQYCKRQLGLNCWGITTTKGGYRKYGSFKEGIKDANDLIERWQKRGRWLTVEDMNGHYVVPRNAEWVGVVNKNLALLETYERRNRPIPQQEHGARGEVQAYHQGDAQRRDLLWVRRRYSLRHLALR